jgi:hypothetical protein
LPWLVVARHIRRQRQRLDSADGQRHIRQNARERGSEQIGQIGQIVGVEED